MDCELFRLLIQKYYDGELSYAEVVEYESHRRKCARCKRVDSEFARVFDALDKIPIYEPSEVFNEAVLRNVDLSKYKEKKVARVLNNIQSIWYNVPFPIRAVSYIGVVLFLALVVFRPLLDLLTVGISKGMTILNGIAGIAAHLLERAYELLSSLGSYKTYEVAFQTLLRTAKVIVDVLPARDIGMVVVMFVLLIVVALAMRKQIRSKGETNVLIS